MLNGLLYKFSSYQSFILCRFPFDEQECNLKFGSWTYDGIFVELEHKTDEVTYKYTNKDGAHIECVEVYLLINSNKFWIL